MSGGGRTEYQVEYCGQGSKLPGSTSKPGGENNQASKIKNEDIQPVGGRMQERARQMSATRRAAENGMLPSGLQETGYNQVRPINGTSLAGATVYDADFIATNVSESDRGVHRAEPQWRDPRWTEAMRINNSTLYEEAERDPPNRNNMYVYQTTRIDPLLTGPSYALAVPDVHKLRYMHGEYMCHDDWY